MAIFSGSTFRWARSPAIWNSRWLIPALAKLRTPILQDGSSPGKQEYASAAARRDLQQVDRGFRPRGSEG